MPAASGEAFEALLSRPLSQALKDRKTDVFILIDALDELVLGESRTQLVGSKLPSLPACVRFILTARPEEDVARALCGLSPLILDRNKAMQSHDIEVFLRVRLADCVVEAEEEAIFPALVSKADGVFLAAQLMVQLLAAESSLGKPLTIDEILAASRGEQFLFNTYHATLHCIDARLVDVAAKEDEQAVTELRTTLPRLLAVLLAAAAPADQPQWCCSLGRQSRRC